MKSYAMAGCIVLLIGALCCLTADANPTPSELDKPTGILIPDKKELTMEGADQSPAESKHWWWYGKDRDWDEKKHGEHHHGEKGDGKYKKIWWWKWW